jgi:pyruvate formate lyase activating enzyme
LIRELRAAKDLTINGEPLSIKLDTNGSNPDVLQELIDEGLVDYVAMDLKAPLQADRYSAITGTSLGAEEMARIRASVQILLCGKVDYEFRTTVAPALLEEEELYAMARRIRGAPHYNLQNFNPRETLDGSLRNLAPVEPERLRRMQKRVNEIIHPNVTSSALRVTSLQLRVGTG